MSRDLNYPRHYNEEGIARLSRFFRTFVLPSMGLTSDDISTIIPPEAPNVVSDRSYYAFNDASAMPSKEQGVSPAEISLPPSDLSSVPLTELELNAKPHRLLLAPFIVLFSLTNPYLVLFSPLRSYCNSNLFVLFRLYGILYDRLKNARALESPSMRQVYLLNAQHLFSPFLTPSLCSVLLFLPRSSGRGSCAAQPRC